MSRDRGDPWRVEFLVGSPGATAKDLVAMLELSRPHEYRRILSKLALFERMGLTMAMDVKLVAPLRGYRGVFELRVKGTGFRFYGFIWRDPARDVRYHLLATAEEKAGSRADDRLLGQAAEARKAWYRLHPTESRGTDE